MAKNWITPTPVKFELRAYGEVYDLSNCIDNWKDLEFTQKRDKTSGIFHQISFPFEFVQDAYDIVKEIFDTHKYRAVGNMYVYLLKDNWPYVEEQYHEPQIFNLDWTTYNKSDSKIEIDTKRTSLYDFVKAKNKIVYDIPVDAIKESKQWNYDRIELENRVVFRCTSNGDTDVSLGGSEAYERTIGITYETTEIAVKDIIEIKTLAFNSKFNRSENVEDEDSYFMKLSDFTDGTDLEFDIDITGTIEATGVKKLTLYMGRGFDGNYEASYEVDLESGKIDWKQRVAFVLNSGDNSKLYLFMRYETPDLFGVINLNIDGTMNLNYNGIYRPVGIDVIDPKVLLQSLVDKMTESKGVYVSDIEDFNTDNSDLIMMSAAESIRGIQTTKDDNDEVITEAQVHTSYRNFVEWMNTYGYEQHIAENKLTFRKRHKGFRSDIIAIELGEKECADLREYVNEDFLYSGLKIGYNKKDLDNPNGRFEFNGTHDYATDLNTGDNILELISPYRADCYGIEFLTQERGKDNKDNKSDKDLFLINVKKEDRGYETIYSTLSGYCYRNTVSQQKRGFAFNGNLNPYNLMKLNENLLGVSVDKVSFAGSDSNSKIVIDGQAIDVSYDIPKGIGLFEPIIYDIASKNIQHLPSGENVNGLIRFHYKGNIYEGFIEEVSKNPAWEMETTWILYKRRN